MTDKKDTTTEIKEKAEEVKADVKEAFQDMETFPRLPLIAGALIALPVLAGFTQGGSSEPKQAKPAIERKAQMAPSFGAGLSAIKRLDIENMRPSYFATTWIGQDVYQGDEDIGELIDFVVKWDGTTVEIDSAVIRAGGFFGIGESELSVPVSRLAETVRWDSDDELRLQLLVSEEELASLLDG